MASTAGGPVADERQRLSAAAAIFNGVSHDVALDGDGSNDQRGDSSGRDDAVVTCFADFVWHFDMLHDHERNALYRQAADAVVHSCHEANCSDTGAGVSCLGVSCLDIGTGSGLLALLAAQAGATRVLAVEVVPRFACLAKANVRRNRFQTDESIETDAGTTFHGAHPDSMPLPRPGKLTGPLPQLSPMATFGERAAAAAAAAVETTTTAAAAAAAVETTTTATEAVEAAGPPPSAATMTPSFASSAASTAARTGGSASAARCPTASGCPPVVTVMNCHSTALSRESAARALGSSSGADVLICELLDTGLLGEGCLSAIRDAAARGLLRPGYRAVPASATVFVQLVECDAAGKWGAVPVDLDPAGVVRACTGGAASSGGGGYESIRLGGLHGAPDAHGNRRLVYRPLTRPAAAFKIDFEHLHEAAERHCVLELEATATGEATAVVAWWEAHMLANTNTTGGPMAAAPDNVAGDAAVGQSQQPQQRDSPLVMSMHPATTSERDHWRQAVYPLSHLVYVGGLGEAVGGRDGGGRASGGATVRLCCSHDDDDFWFCVADNSEPSEPGRVDAAVGAMPSEHSLPAAAAPRLCHGRPLCTCGIHTGLSRAYLWSLHQPARQTLERAMDAVFGAAIGASRAPTIVLVFGDGPLPSLLARRMVRGAWYQVPTLAG
jgi:predicted RNA methylase